jgi:hypothetical protein
VEPEVLQARVDALWALAKLRYPFSGPWFSSAAVQLLAELDPLRPLQWPRAVFFRLLKSAVSAREHVLPPALKQVLDTRGPIKMLPLAFVLAGATRGWLRIKLCWTAFDGVCAPNPMPTGTLARLLFGTLHELLGLKLDGTRPSTRALEDAASVVETRVPEQAHWILDAARSANASIFAALLVAFAPGHLRSLTGLTPPWSRGGLARDLVGLSVPILAVSGSVPPADLEHPLPLCALSSQALFTVGMDDSELSYVGWGGHRLLRGGGYLVRLAGPRMFHAPLPPTSETTQASQTTQTGDEPSVFVQILQLAGQTAELRILQAETSAVQGPPAATQGPPAATGPPELRVVASAKVAVPTSPAFLEAIRVPCGTLVKSAAGEAQREEAHAEALTDAKPETRFEAVVYWGDVDGTANDNATWLHHVGVALRVAHGRVHATFHEGATRDRSASTSESESDLDTTDSESQGNARGKGPISQKADDLASTAFEARFLVPGSNSDTRSADAGAAPGNCLSWRVDWAASETHVIPTTHFFWQDTLLASISNVSAVAAWSGGPCVGSLALVSGDAAGVGAHVDGGAQRAAEMHATCIAIAWIADGRALRVFLPPPSESAHETHAAPKPFVTMAALPPHVPVAAVTSLCA